MTDLQGTVLRGLSGESPLGLMAALGVQVALSEQGHEHKLHWSDEPVAHPILTPALSAEAIARAVRQHVQHWLEGPVFSRHLEQTLKMEEHYARMYLQNAKNAGMQGILALCLLAEGSRYKSGNSVGKSKPTDFYFTAARQQFLAMARSRLESTDPEAIVSDISDTWRYECTDNNSLMWDLCADRHHAYSSADPNDRNSNPKETNAGAETLAILGLSLFPCYSASGDIRTQGFEREGAFKYFTWPLWTIPATKYMIKSLLSHVKSPYNDKESRHLAYSAWGVMRVVQSQVRSRGQGFRTFGPPRVVWQRD